MKGKNMQKILCFGELLVYWIPRSSETIGDLHVPLYAQFPGGAPANVAVGCQCLGIESALVGQIGFDAIGRYLKDCLKKYHVDTQYLLKSDHPTAMAFLHMDIKGNRSFSFNRDDTADLNYPASELCEQMFENVGIFYLNSNTLTEDAIYDCSLQAMKMAQKQLTLTHFDVNLRLMVWQDIQQVKPRIMQTLQFADIAKFRVEEINYLRGLKTEQEFLVELFECGLQVIIITDAEQAMRLYTQSHHQSFMTPKVTVVDNTVAADAFSSGWLSGLIEQGIHNPSQLRNACSKITPLIDAVNIAMCCGAYAVTQKGAWNAFPKRADINDLLHSIEKI